MIRSFRTLALALTLALAAQAALADNPKAKPPAGAKAAAEKCQHGVKKGLCTRCNPKLEAVYKSKGDWCEEHKRAESQCVLCHPELAKEGVK